jgi:hypothetical protein
MVLTPADCWRIFSRNLSLSIYVADSLNISVFAGKSAAPSSVGLSVICLQIKISSRIIYKQIAVRDWIGWHCPVFQRSQSYVDHKAKKKRRPVTLLLSSGKIGLLPGFSSLRGSWCKSPSNAWATWWRNTSNVGAVWKRTATTSSSVALLLRRYGPLCTLTPPAQLSAVYGLFPVRQRCLPSILVAFCFWYAGWCGLPRGVPVAQALLALMQGGSASLVLPPAGGRSLSHRRSLVSPLFFKCKP